MEGPKTMEKMTVWMGHSNHGVVGSHIFENKDEKADKIRTANYIAMLRGKVTRTNIVNVLVNDSPLNRFIVELFILSK